MRRAATRKISRLKTQHGVHVSGTEFDPRRATTTPKTYTAKQLAAYQSRLQSFLSRSNQFVPDASKQPIPRAEFQAYKRHEVAYREAAGSVYERIKNVELPSGETVAERLAKMNVLHKAMHNPAANMVYDPVTRESQDIAGISGLRKLSKAMKRDSTRAAMNRKVASARDAFEKMADVINAPELAREANTLTPNQFVALWNYTTFATAVSLTYSSAKNMLSAKESVWAHNRLRDQMNDAMAMIQWAKGLPI